jgi:hypothetical protein
MSSTPQHVRRTVSASRKAVPVWGEYRHLGRTQPLSLGKNVIVFAVDHSHLPRLVLCISFVVVSKSSTNRHVRSSGISGWRQILCLYEPPCRCALKPAALNNSCRLIIFDFFYEFRKPVVGRHSTTMSLNRAQDCVLLGADDEVVFGCGWTEGPFPPSRKAVSLAKRWYVHRYPYPFRLQPNHALLFASDSCPAFSRNYILQHSPRPASSGFDTRWLSRLSTTVWARYV